MRWSLAALVLALASGVAHARPVPSDAKSKTVMKARCPATTSWRAFTRCQLGKRKFDLVADLPTAKLISLPLQGARSFRLLALYLLAEQGWVSTSFSADIDDRSEVLAVTPLPDGAHRVDIGTSSPLWVTLDGITQRPAVLRRRMVHVCKVNGGCSRAQASCEVLVHGKAIESYRTMPIWDGQTLRLRGDVENTNRYCTPPRGMMVE